MPSKAADAWGSSDQAGASHPQTAETRLVTSGPGSQSFEMPDVPAIAAAAHAHGVLVIDDNTWAAPLFRRSLEQGVDISILAATISVAIPTSCSGLRTLR